jgi:hypothetical protein
MVDSFDSRKGRKNMLKFRTWKKYIRFLLIALIFLPVASEIFAQQEEQEGETVYPVPPLLESILEHPIPDQEFWCVCIGILT